MNNVTLNTPLEVIIRNNNVAVYSIRHKCRLLGFEVESLGDLIECVKYYGIHRRLAGSKNSCRFFLYAPDPTWEARGTESALNNSTFFHSLGYISSARIRDAFDAVGFNWRAYIGKQVQRPVVEQTTATKNELLAAVQELRSAVDRLLDLLEREEVSNDQALQC